MVSQGNNRQRLAKSSRLRAATDFVEIKKFGRRFRGKQLALFVLERAGENRRNTNKTAPLRLAVVIGRKIGQATVRNRWRRRIRELFRREIMPRWRLEKPGKRADFLVIVKLPGKAPSLDELRQELNGMAL